MSKDEGAETHSWAGGGVGSATAVRFTKAREGARPEGWEVGDKSWGSQQLTLQISTSPLNVLGHLPGAEQREENEMM